MKFHIMLMAVLTLTSTTTYARMEKAIPVNFIILQEDGGIGNEIYAENNIYIDKVLAKINADYFKSTSTELVRGYKKIVKNSRDYSSPMSDGSKPLIKKYDDYDKKGEILIVVAREEKVDVNGRAEEQGYDYSPTMIIRSVVHGQDSSKSDWVAGERSIRTTAGLIVHEMAHMMGLRHAKSKESTQLHTDNLTKRSDGEVHYKKYLDKLAGYGKKSVNVGGVVSPPVNPGSPGLPSLPDWKRELIRERFVNGRGYLP